jgi:hypothetical protein
MIAGTRDQRDGVQHASVPTTGEGLGGCLGPHFGNADQQVLPAGVVCRSCNNYFGAKVDPELLDFPPLRMHAAFLEVMSTRDNWFFVDVTSENRNVLFEDRQSSSALPTLSSRPSASARRSQVAAGRVPPAAKVVSAFDAMIARVGNVPSAFSA